MKILMVCLGNICRSPIADGLLRKKVKELGFAVEVDSAGTSGLHAGEQPDQRMMETALGFGCDISDLRSRKFEPKDFDRFDLIYVMDESNYSNVIQHAKNASQEKKVRFLLNEIKPDANAPVPDPYYGGKQGFIDVYNMVDAATDKIIEKIQNNILV